MVIPRHFKYLIVLILSAIVAIGYVIWLYNKTESDQHLADDRSNSSLPITHNVIKSEKASIYMGKLCIASLQIEAAMNEARWPSQFTKKTQTSTPLNTFVSATSALASGDLRIFALAMSKSAQTAFLEGRSIDDPYLQSLSDKMAKTGFQSLTVESFKVERIAEICKLMATVSSIRGKQKIYEEITMELKDSKPGWLIEKYENRIAKREAIHADKR